MIFSPSFFFYFIIDNDSDIDIVIDNKTASHVFSY